MLILGTIRQKIKGKSKTLPLFIERFLKNFSFLLTHFYFQYIFINYIYIRRKLNVYIFFNGAYLLFIIYLFQIEKKQNTKWCSVFIGCGEGI